MTEAQWLACDELAVMLPLIQGQVSKRKLRLFAVACCRDVWHLLPDARARQAVEAAERYADAMLTEDERRSARHRAQRARGAAPNHSRIQAATQAVYESLNPDATVAASYSSDYIAPYSLDKPKRATHILFLRDIVGNPFHPVPIDPRWLTSTVVTLAEGIYTDRAFDRLPILADALQDAGCEDADLLAHCRGPGPHARGCWVVDLVTGRG